MPVPPWRSRPSSAVRLTLTAAAQAGGSYSASRNFISATTSSCRTSPVGAERLPAIPNVDYLTLAPDWICEVVSPSTESIDRGKKLRIYAREGVLHAWLVDPLRQSLEVLALQSGSLVEIEEHRGNVTVRVCPFDAVELELRALWN